MTRLKKARKPRSAYNQWRREVARGRCKLPYRAWQYNQYWQRVDRFTKKLAVFLQRAPIAKPHDADAKAVDAWRLRAATAAVNMLKVDHRRRHTGGNTYGWLVSIMNLTGIQREAFNRGINCVQGPIDESGLHEVATSLAVPEDKPVCNGAPRDGILRVYHSDKCELDDSYCCGRALGRHLRGQSVDQPFNL